MSYKADTNKLIELYALKIFSARGDTSFKVQKRFHDKFKKFHERLQKKYPDIDMESPSFWDVLQDKSSSWWDSRIVRGPGKDW